MSYDGSDALDLGDGIISDPHPRPQLERVGWISLNGEWDFAIDETNCCRTSEEVCG